MKGANYAVRSAELKPEYFNNLSAAKIYYKTGYDDLAKKYAKQAIVEGKKKGMNVNEAEIMVNELGDKPAIKNDTQKWYHFVPKKHRNHLLYWCNLI